MISLFLISYLMLSKRGKISITNNNRLTKTSEPSISLTLSITDWVDVQEPETDTR